MRVRRLAWVVVLLGCAARAPAATDWWKRAVFYEIYPRSFQDTNGDGIGDLAGITARLDYLAELGVDAIWITPFYPSPQVDFGYDVSDYRNVDPQFGTLADLDRLIAEAHARKIRVIADLVLNHSSDQHAFFRDARSSPTAAHRSWYVWHDPAPGGGPPNNWASCFEASAWTLDAASGQYYYHGFYAAQPDLNWREPAVEKEIFDTVAWWFSRGVDGFRLDAVNWLFEDPALADNPPAPPGHGGCATEDAQILAHNRDRPEVHEVLTRLRAVADRFPGRILVGEAYVPPEQLLRYYGVKDDELHMPFNFSLLTVPRLDAALFRAEVERAERVLGGRWTTFVLDNHDNPRSWDRFGDGRHDAEIAALLMTMLLTLRGTPFLYYGQELGMVTTVPERIEDVRDPIGRTFWPRVKGRDGERTPMQWDATANAGFSTATPWLKVPPTGTRKSVAAERADPRSLLSFTKRLIAYRRASRDLLDGGYASLGSDPHVFAYRRGERVVVALNMSEAPAKLAVGGKIVVSNVREEGGVVREIELAAFEGVVVETK